MCLRPSRLRGWVHAVPARAACLRSGYSLCDFVSLRCAQWPRVVVESTAGCHSLEVRSRPDARAHPGYLLCTQCREQWRSGKPAYAFVGDGSRGACLSSRRTEGTTEPSAYKHYRPNFVRSYCCVARTFVRPVNGAMPLPRLGSSPTKHGDLESSAGLAPPSVARRMESRTDALRADR